MTHLVLRRNIANEDAFAKAVNMYASELQAYRTHMDNVAAGKADPYPSPHAPPDIAASVNSETAQPDFAIVDCLPVAKGDMAGLIQRQHELHHQVQQREAVELHNLLPARKWRLAGLKFIAAQEIPESRRTPEEHQICLENAVRTEKLRKIHLHFAQLESEIEDLNFDTVNIWVPRPFGG